MPYIGKQLVRGQNRELDDISGSFNGSNTTFNLTAGGDAVTPGTALQLFISLGGILQNPNNDFSVSGNQIIFSTPPASGLDFFGYLQGDAVDFNTPADGSITTVKLDSNLTINVGDGSASTPSIQFFGSGTDTGFYSPGADQVAITTGGTGRLFVDASGNVGVGTTSPDSYATGYKDLVVGNHTGNHGITIASQNTATGRILFADGTGGLEVDVGEISYNHANNSLSISTNRSTAATIDSSGRLLVGTSTVLDVFGSQNPLLQVYGTSTGNRGRVSIAYNNAESNGPGIHFNKSPGTLDALVSNNDQLGGIFFEGGDGDEQIRGASIEAYVDGTPGSNDMPGRLVFSTTADGNSSPTERMRIGSSGLVEIDQVRCDAGGGLDFLPSTVNRVVLRARSTTTGAATLCIFVNPNGTVGSISTSGSATAYNTTSDYRLKENVVPLTGAVDRLNQLQVHRFNFIADPDTTFDGFLAHEAQAVVPECVTGTRDGVEVWEEGEELPDGVSVGDNKLDENGNTIPVYQGIDQSKLVPLLTAALQEALQKIETLEQRLNDAGIA